MMKVIFIFLVFLIFSCKDSKNKKVFQDFEKSISLDKKYYPIQNLDLINKSEQILIYYPEAMDVIRYSGIVININFKSDEEFDSELNRISKLFKIDELNSIENMNFYKSNDEMSFKKCYSDFFKNEVDIKFYSLYKNDTIVSGAFVNKSNNDIMYILFNNKEN